MSNLEEEIIEETTPIRGNLEYKRDVVD